MIVVTDLGPIDCLHPACRMSLLHRDPCLGAVFMERTARMDKLAFAVLGPHVRRATGVERWQGAIDLGTEPETVLVWRDLDGNLITDFGES